MKKKVLLVKYFLFVHILYKKTTFKTLVQPHPLAQAF